MPQPEFPTLTRLGYGAANIGNLFRVMSDDQAWSILETAWDCGLRYFDTAPHYGLGLSERRLGEFLRTKPRNEFVISTKVGRLLRPNPNDDGGLDTAHDFHVRTTLRREWDFSEAGIAASLAESLERLGLDRVDILFLHDPERHDLDLALEEGFPALERLRASGAVDGVGVGSMVTDALMASTRSADLDLVMIAGRYTILEQTAAADVLPMCRDRGTGVVAASVFNSGLLAQNEPTREGRYEYGRVPDDLWDRLERIVSVCGSHNVPLPAAAIQFPLREAVVRSVVVGASRPEQIRRNFELMEVQIPESFWEELSVTR